jgi:predicted enzyme related to lactoylglutathione lyase
MNLSTATVGHAEFTDPDGNQLALMSELAVSGTV